ESFYQDIDLLQNHGINVADIKKLKSAGICTIKVGLYSPSQPFCLVIQRSSPTSALHDETKTAAKETTTSLDIIVYIAPKHLSVQMGDTLTVKGRGGGALMGNGGIESMSITEVFGEFRTGKTQLSHTLCVTAQLPGANGYTGGKVIFIDTESADSLTRSSRPDRLREIADRFNLDQNAMLDNVLYCRAYTSEHQYELMDCVAAKFHEEPGVFKLMIIDSIMALFRVDFCGRGELADRQQKLAQMLSRLQKLSEEFNVAVFITNQMTADPGADPKKPIGGHILAHASTTRISLRKGRGETRIAKIYDSPDLPENEATFAVTTGGIADAKEIINKHSDINKYLSLCKKSSINR
ncbi:unnamed protein product, partial [Porites evermanni]